MKTTKTKAPKAEAKAPKAEAKAELPYVIIRTRDAGCFAGELVSRTGDEVNLRDSRRLWHWKGANTLSDLAMSGTSKPAECRFPEPVAAHIVLGVIEVIACTQAARDAIASVPVWRA